MRYDVYKQKLLKALDADSDIVEWITVKGNHIPIKKGQTKEEAVKSFIESKSKADKIQGEKNRENVKNYVKMINQPGLNWQKPYKGELENRQEYLENLIKKLSKSIDRTKQY